MNWKLLLHVFDCDVGYGYSQIGAQYRDGKAFHEREDVTAANDQDQISDGERKANECEQHQEDDEGCPEILCLHPYENFFGCALERG